MHKMVVHGLTLDPLTNMPIVILKDKESQRALPIWIGVFEANAILLELEKIDTPRPMTHDLLKNVIEGFKGKVKRVVVSDLKDSTYYANIEITVNNSNVKIDSRPSDAIALALRTNSPIYVTEKVIASSKIIDKADDDEKIKEWLEDLKPEDFGKYRGG
ncbi:bifunctional nuclease family protein [candidate division CSSED10-310 bacterium]|uniref:Bifunctional nuclease family protein n=1 Tax=candidate division CSSED10-310 bacterium TaxID=2855610 RepID=A0ABV6Z5V5_UNCC1